MQFNNWESCADSTVRADANGHLALYREIGVGIVQKPFSGIPDFSAEKACVDRTAHAELVDHAGSDATDLVSHDRVAGAATQTRNFHLDGVGLIQRQPIPCFGEIGSRRASLVIVPLPRSQSLEYGTGLCVHHRLGQSLFCYDIVVQRDSRGHERAACELAVAHAICTSWSRLKRPAGIR